MTGRRSREEEARLDALAQAVERFAKERALLRALTTLKQMMDLAPKDPRTERAMALISSPDVRGHPTKASKPSAPADKRDRWQTIPPGTVLAAIPLAQLEAKVEPLIEITPQVEPETVEIAVADSHDVRPEFPVTPLFSGLDALGFDMLVDRLKVLRVRKGETVFRQGDRSKSLYVVSEGAVRVLLEAPKRQEIARLDAGEFFGEIALITDRPRTATIEALEDTLLIEIEPQAISALLMADPDAMQVILWFLRDRLVDLLIRTHPLFQRLSQIEGRTLASRFTIVEAKDGAVLIEQGVRGRGLMIVLIGEAEVVRGFGQESVKLATLGPGDIFGEMSLLSKEPAIATVRAKGRFIALELLADRFQRLIDAHPELGDLMTRLAEERRQRFVEIVDGRTAYAEGHLDLL